MNNSTSPNIIFEEHSNHIYLFDEVYPLQAAKEQAEKKKLNAFGVIAKYNPLGRPKPESVLLQRHEVRLEPFWHIVAIREVDYESQVTYPIPVHNPHAQGVSLNGKRLEVARRSDKGSIDVPSLTIAWLKTVVVTS